MSSEVQSKLSWKSQDNPPEINAMLTTLSADYPLCDGGKGLKLKFRKNIFILPQPVKRGTDYLFHNFHFSLSSNAAIAAVRL